MEAFIQESRIDTVETLFVSDDSEHLEKVERNLSGSERIKGYFSTDRDESEEILDSFDDIECVVLGKELIKDRGVSFLNYVTTNFPKITTIVFIDAESGEMVDKALSKEADDYMLKYEQQNCIELLEKRILNAVRSKKRAQTTSRILERITDGFMAFDEEDRISYLNEEVCRMLQKDEEELMGGKIWEKFSEALGTKFEKNYRKAMETQRPVYFEEYYPPVDGWFSVKGYPSQTGLTAYIQDITERRKREERLEGRVEQQNITNDLLRMALEEKDPVEIQYTAVEQITKNLGTDFARIMKFEPGSEKLELAAQYRMKNPEVTERSIDIDESYQESFTFDAKESLVVDYYNKDPEFERTKMMSFLGVNSGISVLIGEYSNPWGVISTFNRGGRNYSPDDIRFAEGIANVLATSIEYQEKNRELREYQMAVDSVNYGISMVDSNQKIVMSNKAFQELSGYPRGQLVGKKFNFLAEFLKENRDKDEAVIRTRDGEEVKVNMHLSPVTLPNGTKGHVAVVHEKEKIGQSN